MLRCANEDMDERRLFVDQLHVREVYIQVRESTIRGTGDTNR